VDFAESSPKATRWCPHQFVRRWGNNPIRKTTRLIAVELWNNVAAIENYSPDSTRQSERHGRTGFFSGVNRSYAQTVWKNVYFSKAVGVNRRELILIPSTGQLSIDVPSYSRIRGARKIPVPNRSFSFRRVKKRLGDAGHFFFYCNAQVIYPTRQNRSRAGCTAVSQLVCRSAGTFTLVSIPRFAAIQALGIDAALREFYSVRTSARIPLQ